MQPAARRSIRYVVLVVLALAACAGSSAVASGNSARGRDDARLLVKFRAGTSREATARALSNAGARELRTVPKLGIRVATVPSWGVDTALNRLNASRFVEYAERDVVRKPQEVLPNDPFFPQQYSLMGGAWGWSKTRTTQAWAITQGDPSVVVAVLDTGLKNLADFGGQTVTGWNVLNNSTDTTTNAGKHGTYVAGVAGLAVGNGQGNAGYCPGCRIMPVQVGTDSGAYDSNLATGIIWAADHGARVENLSWAGPSSSSTIANAVSYARSKGVVVVAAAGNSNCDCPNYPAATPGVLGVAGTTSTDAKQGDSNYGSWVALAAPESNMTVWPAINVTSGPPGYAPVGGTSLAAPVISAIAGLLFSYNHTLSGAQVEQAFASSATPVGFVKYGRVDALGALQSLGAADPQAASAPINTIAPQLLALLNNGTDTAPLTAAPQPGQVLTRGQGAWRGSAPLSLSAVQWQRCDTGLSCTTVATAASYTVQSADAGYALRLVVTVKNGLGTTSLASPTSLPVGGSTISLPPSNTSPPTISGTAQEGQTLTASTGAWSGSPTSYAYQWLRCDSSGASCAAIAGATSSSYVVQTGDVGSTLSVGVTASSSAGSSTAVSAQTAVVASAPTPSPSPPTTQTLTFSGSLNPKNPSRSFSVTVGAGTAHAQLFFSRCSALNLKVYAGPSLAASKNGPSVVVLDANLASGTYNYEVSGGRCSFTLTVTSSSP